MNKSKVITSGSIMSVSETDSESYDTVINMLQFDDLTLINLKHRIPKLSKILLSQLKTKITRKEQIIDTVITI